MLKMANTNIIIVCPQIKVASTAALYSTDRDFVEPNLITSVDVGNGVCTIKTILNLTLKITDII